MVATKSNMIQRCRLRLKVNSPWHGIGACGSLCAGRPGAGRTLARDWPARQEARDWQLPRKENHEGASMSSLFFDT